MHRCTVSACEALSNKPQIFIAPLRGRTSLVTAAIIYPFAKNIYIWQDGQK